MSGAPERGVISSERLSELTGFTAAQVRRDLAYFGAFGKRGVGYAVMTLCGQIASILGLDRRWRVGLVGVGNLGKALLFYRGFADQGFEFVATFDIDPAKIGTTLGALEVQPIADLAASAPGDRVDIVLVAGPADAAQSVVDGAVAAGVRAILNFAPVQLRVPPEVRLSNVDLSMEVEYLTYSLMT